jgi:CRP-like cAMP-binding protein
VEKIISALSLCHLFQKLNIIEIEKVVKEMNYKLACYKKNDVLAIEGDPCTSIGIVIEGRIEINKLLANGKNVNMETLCRGDVFGEVILFFGEQLSGYNSCIPELGSTVHIKRRDIENTFSE